MPHITIYKFPMLVWVMPTIKVIRLGEFKLEVSKVDTNGKPTAFELTVNGTKVASTDVTIAIDPAIWKRLR